MGSLCSTPAHFESITINYKKSSYLLLLYRIFVKVLVSNVNVSQNIIRKPESCTKFFSAIFRENFNYIDPYFVYILVNVVNFDVVKYLSALAICLQFLSYLPWCFNNYYSNIKGCIALPFFHTISKYKK